LNSSRLALRARSISQDRPGIGETAIRAGSMTPDTQIQTETVPAGLCLNARYVLQERLGLGGRGEVWRARDSIHGTDVALRILRVSAKHSSGAWEMLLQEYDNASRLDHPHILKVYPPERYELGFLLPMELATGGDLSWLRGASYLSIVRVFIEVAQALEHAHERGVIHRDLKAGNVLFDARGRVKLADFGASACDVSSGAVKRPPLNASPEQLRGEPPTPADDIYALGALAYELLSKHPPHYGQEAPWPPLIPIEEIPPRLHALIMRMLAKEASERPASMHEVIEAMGATLNDTLTFDSDSDASTLAAPARGATSAGGAAIERRPRLWPPRLKLNSLRDPAPGVLLLLGALGGALAAGVAAVVVLSARIARAPAPPVAASPATVTESAVVHARAMPAAAAAASAVAVVPPVAVSPSAPETPATATAIRPVAPATPARTAPPSHVGSRHVVAARHESSPSAKVPSRGAADSSASARVAAASADLPARDSGAGDPQDTRSAPQTVSPTVVERVLGGPVKGFPSAGDYYPDYSRRFGEKGVATVQVCVDVAGRLSSPPTLAESSGSARLDKSALKLARAGTGHYQPTTEDGRPVSSCYPVRIRFALKD
jgi:serine/threonine-protein kinase